MRSAQHDPAAALALQPADRPSWSGKTELAQGCAGTRLRGLWPGKRKTRPGGQPGGSEPYWRFGWMGARAEYGPYGEILLPPNKSCGAVKGSSACDYFFGSHFRSRGAASTRRSTRRSSRSLPTRWGRSEIFWGTSDRRKGNYGAATASVTIFSACSLVSTPSSSLRSSGRSPSCSRNTPPLPFSSTAA